MARLLTGKGGTSYYLDPKANPVRDSGVNRCPECNFTLKLRKGRFGDFFACPNWPTCKYTHSA